MKKKGTESKTRCAKPKSSKELRAVLPSQETLS